ncbi:hypothetical protein P7K49_001949, partial [Saguinus oedipus]
GSLQAPPCPGSLASKWGPRAAERTSLSQRNSLAVGPVMSRQKSKSTTVSTGAVEGMLGRAVGLEAAPHS